MPDERGREDDGDGTDRVADEFQREQVTDAQPHEKGEHSRKGIQDVVGLGAVRELRGCFVVITAIVEPSVGARVEPALPDEVGVDVEREDKTEAHDQHDRDYQPGRRQPPDPRGGGRYEPGPPGDGHRIGTHGRLAVVRSKTARHCSRSVNDSTPSWHGSGCTRRRSVNPASIRAASQAKPLW